MVYVNIWHYLLVAIMNSIPYVSHIMLFLIGGVLFFARASKSVGLQPLRLPVGLSAGGKLGVAALQHDVSDSV
jgi:hypothetical protein